MSIEQIRVSELDEGVLAEADTTDVEEGSTIEEPKVFETLPTIAHRLEASQIRLEACLRENGILGEKRDVKAGKATVYDAVAAETAWRSRQPKTRAPAKEVREAVTVDESAYATLAVLANHLGMSEQYVREKAKELTPVRANVRGGIATVYNKNEVLARCKSEMKQADDAGFIAQPRAGTIAAWAHEWKIAESDVRYMFEHFPRTKMQPLYGFISNGRLGEFYDYAKAEYCLHMWQTLKEREAAETKAKIEAAKPGLLGNIKGRLARFFSRA